MQSLKGRIRRWLTRNQPQAQHSATLDRKQIFILPTKAGLILALVLFAMLLAALNYDNSLAFLFTFLLTGLALNTMWYTHRQLSGIELTVLPQKNRFVGEDGYVQIQLRNRADISRYSLNFTAAMSENSQIVDCAANNDIIVQMDAHPRQRGLFRYDRFKISTQAPLGLFNAWSWQTLDIGFWVYPEPVALHPAPLGNDPDQERNTQNNSPGDDFDGLREYRPGDALQHIAWKKLAHNDEFMVKLFSSDKKQGLIYSWDEMTTPNVEEKLSGLCYWIVTAEQRNERYGLQLPNVFIPAGNGDTHFHHCLEALAQFEQAR